MLLAENGAAVAVVDKNEVGAKDTVEQIEALGSEGIALKADLTVDDDIQSFVEQTVSAFERLDILVNNVFAPALDNYVNNCIRERGVSLMHNHHRKTSPLALGSIASGLAKATVALSCLLTATAGVAQTVLEEVLVTSTKRGPSSLMDLPISVNVATGDDLKFKASISGRGN